MVALCSHSSENVSQLAKSIMLYMFSREGKRLKPGDYHALHKALRYFEPSGITGVLENIEEILQDMPHESTVTKIEQEVEQALKMTPLVIESSPRVIALDVDFLVNGIVVVSDDLKN